VTRRPSDEGSDRVALSTGHEVALPLETEAAAVGAAFAGNASAVDAALPDPLAPVRIAPGRAPVVLVGVGYRRIGDGAMAAYDEFGVLLPATHHPEDGPVGAERAAVRHGVGAYVDWLPVTTDPGRALGVEVWGYPKEVRAIDVVDGCDRHRVTVGADGERVAELSVNRTPTVDGRLRATSFAGSDAVREIEHLLDGRIGGWLGGATLSLGSQPRADRLREFGLVDGQRAFARLRFDGRFAVGRGELLPP
jgi:hypothetical protein